MNPEVGADYACCAVRKDSGDASDITNGILVTSNFIGDGVQAAMSARFERILLVGHLGKLVKLAIGMTYLFYQC